MDSDLDEPLAELLVADSRFLGFVKRINSKEEAISFQEILKSRFPDAAHVPVAFQVEDRSGWDEDGEPQGSTGPGMKREIEKISRPEEGGSKNALKGRGIAVGVVRFFGEKLLGVTCGRLTQCYESITYLTLQRCLYGSDIPVYREIDTTDYQKIGAIYGLGSGDCEVIFDVVTHLEESKDDLFNKVRDELDFDGFVGAKGEVLPRLQNLQADLSTQTVPVYRYPGNYRGDEWTTFGWSPTSERIREAVHERLCPLYEQHMNHCVTNYYQIGSHFIAHHSDKDLDLNRSGVIVSISLGGERVLELRRRKEPRDVTRVVLPHGSMLVLGPNTNRFFTHSILQKPEEDTSTPNSRISLTFRHVVTYLDKSSMRLFGQGVKRNKTLSDVRKSRALEQVIFAGGYASIVGAIFGTRARKRPLSINGTCLLFAGYLAGAFTFEKCCYLWECWRDEKLARDFFSKSSSSGTKY